MILGVSDLGCARGGIAVLQGVTFAIAAGEAVVLRGPNGIGKTTLLRCIAGLQPLLSGSVTAPPEGVAYSGHADGIKSTLTVAENLRFWADIYGVADGRSAVERAIGAMNLRPLRARPAQNLSAGQKRRLGLARLLVTGRRLWVMDEPTVSLDTASVEHFAAMVQAHLAGGGAALVATHIDLGLPEARTLDLLPWRAVQGSMAGDAFAGAFAGDFR